MLPTVTATGSPRTQGALRTLLDLLAAGAPAEDFARPAARARADGASAAELAEVDEATRVALRIRRTLSQHRVREAELTALFDTASDLAALRDLDAVLRAIVHRAKLLLGTDITYLSLNDETAGDTYMRVTDGSVAASFQQVRLGMGEGLGGLVAQSARPYATDDYQADNRFHHTDTIDGAVLDEGLRAILGVPLRLGSRVIGVLYAADRTPRRFAREEVALLSSLADHAAIAIDGARLLEETRTALGDLGAANDTIRAHNQAMHRTEEAHDHLTDLVLRGADATEVAAGIAALLDGGILIHDADGTELARTGTAPLTPPVDGVAASRTSGRAVPVEAAAGTWVCAVLAGPELLGSIALTGRPDLPDTDRLLFERAGIVTALLLLLRRSAAETEDRVRAELLYDLLTATGDGGALAARARRVGVQLSRPHAVLVAHGEAATRQRLLSAAAQSARTRGGLAGIHHDHVVLAVPSKAPGRCAQEMAAELGKALGSPVTVGAAGAAAEPGTGDGTGSLPTAHEEAQRCLSALLALGHTGNGAALPDLGFLGVLLGDQADLAGYVRNTLGPVLDYDARRGTELVRTLDAYFVHGASLTRTKTALHIHVNTVVQRLERIGRLLGKDWNAPARSLEIQLALRLHHLAQDL
ncbi:helix-turn-helix domain-containing protein [Streptomyces sp. DSM 42041]|uniref:Helix-turn-helix domain-containing protein n=1 Tax=Streptomyces hazeniae TaxID=3075538 RepID=A0ABU2NT77_9ACTN|nr:GAF domain-containing protein [Streptomyces sp. DSM 42041]MDT0379930.1 helix-turn-helix domain-containing protein [Streptomyces sp. DSM 42041]